MQAEICGIVPEPRVVKFVQSNDLGYATGGEVWDPTLGLPAPIGRPQRGGSVERGERDLRLALCAPEPITKVMPKTTSGGSPAKANISATGGTVDRGGAEGEAGALAISWGAERSSSTVSIRTTKNAKGETVTEIEA